ncbi:NAD(P)H-hydrate dehydratase [Chitinophagaceae bacterium LB-8]|uniref:Bifunctional NAD(P)H-hydrate repair enzyme n=1 Tax=Paraflavisolibacter caeni TaxID=2982496 RepID=A0A9X2XNN1_9BACT|nr:NAD(P)H-hydrate dehydratase [Paraflavisolibacter caeni]MCU7549178.1 NAD(P)H-hydrate dehydratase [Paraflavisolibacter caeni]
MKIYNAYQIKEWDQYTIAHEPILSVDLMERAAQKCVLWILAQNWSNKQFIIFCGKGNNGGDGLAIARLLKEKGKRVVVYILEFGRLGSDDFQTNLRRLHELPIDIHFIQSPDMFPHIGTGDIVIDALFGSGLNKPLEGLSAALVFHVNHSPATVISIDVPSGLYIDQSSVGNTIVKADITLTFQIHKLSFLLPESQDYVGNVQVLDIGLHPGFEEPTDFQLLDLLHIKGIYKPRQEFAHKGTFGHTLLIGGSYGKIGAVVLAAKSSLRSGAGLVTVFIPQCGYQILQTSVPEAMAMTGEDIGLIDNLPPDLERFSAIGIGPGLGTDPKTQKAVVNLVKSMKKPIIVDADALNCLSLHKEILFKLPPYSILTPHPKEFERLFGVSSNDFDRIQLAKEKAKELNIIIILKGHHTFMAMPTGISYFNNTGNAGMATGGTGDVLTGILTSLVGQGYEPVDAALLGVYLHGLAGDIAAENNSMEALIAGDLAGYLGSAFKRIQ